MKTIGIDEFVQTIRADFKQRIERKTGWGKNEVVTEFDAAIYAAAMKVLKPTDYPRPDEDGGL